MKCAVFLGSILVIGLVAPVMAAEPPVKSGVHVSQLTQHWCLTSIFYVW
jgi:hypothetical protein